MLVSQRSAYQLQQKLAEINKLEFDELHKPYGGFFTEGTLEALERQKLIWWAYHKNDVIAGCIVAAVIGLSVYFVVG